MQRFFAARPSRLHLIETITDAAFKSGLVTVPCGLVRRLPLAKCEWPESEKALRAMWFYDSDHGTDDIRNLPTD